MRSQCEMRCNCAAREAREAAAKQAASADSTPPQTTVSHSSQLDPFRAARTMEDLLDPDEMLELEVMIDQFDAQTDALCSAIMELPEEWPEYDPAMPEAPLEMERGEVEELCQARPNGGPPLRRRRSGTSQTPTGARAGGAARSPQGLPGSASCGTTRAGS